MNQEAILISRSIEAVSNALAQWVVERHAEADPTLAERYEGNWRSNWVANVHARLTYLAQAVAVRCPAVFSESVLWNREAIVAREGRVEDLTASLNHMRAVIANELPALEARAATECIDAAIVATAKARSSQFVDAANLPSRDVVLQYLECLLMSKRAEAIELVLNLARSGTPITSLYIDVLQPAQAEVGRMWHRNEISVADEHYATAVTQEVMSRLREFAQPGTPRHLGVVAASVGGDFHELGIRMVADCFELDGWAVTYLGANLPAVEAVRVVQESKAQVLAISASTFLHLREVGSLIDAMRAAPAGANVKIIVGGPPFNLIPELWVELGADGCATSAVDAVSLAGRLVSNAACD
ncbi:hypothetical protein B7486_02170 [cyanobacterium TDX16]|nr:hypothetical protein B7486_02170 [cyanobacterium TDX16]